MPSSSPTRPRPRTVSSKGCTDSPGSSASTRRSTCRTKRRSRRRWSGSIPTSSSSRSGGSAQTRRISSGRSTSWRTFRPESSSSPTRGSSPASRCSRSSEPGSTRSSCATSHAIPISQRPSRSSCVDPKLPASEPGPGEEVGTGSSDSNGRVRVPAERVEPGLTARFDGLAIMTAVFVSGAVLLGVEIAASRVLAPYFGNSLFVWGSLIGVVLTGLAVGYWLGGALADRLPATGLLLGVMALAALTILLIPIIDEPVLEAVVSWDPGPRLNPLIAAIALFGLPSVLMAGVTPIAVRLRAQSLTRVGRTAGRLFATSTAGSIFGTLATSFFLIPEFGTDQLIGIAAAALFAAVAAVALAERLVIAAVLAAVATVGAGYAATELAPETGGTLSEAAAQNWSPLYRTRGSETVLDARDPRAVVPVEDLRVVYSRDTQYHRLSVVEDADTRYLRFDNSLQSAMYVDDPLRTRFAYTDLFHLAVAYNPDAENILFIGLGAGSSEKRMLQDFPEVQMQAVEIDPVVVDVAHDYFAVP